MEMYVSGESHGQKLIGTIVGFPANFPIDENVIVQELQRRRSGYGRGARMTIENEAFSLVSGVYAGLTTGAPLSIEIPNRDYANWIDSIMEPITIPRPGHADLAGLLKYRYPHFRPVMERASARITAGYVSVSALCKHLLETLGVTFSSRPAQVDGIVNTAVTGYDDAIKLHIDKATADNRSLGGVVTVQIAGVPAGLGSFVHWDTRIDGKLSAMLMSIPSVKGVVFGSADDPERYTQDELFIQDEQIYRKTNNAGGVEGGMTNGEAIEMRLFVKPIPSSSATRHSVDMASMQEVTARHERSDICVVDTIGVIAENLSAFVVLQACMDRFGSDDFRMLMQRIRAGENV